MIRIVKFCLQITQQRPLIHWHLRWLDGQSDFSNRRLRNDHKSKREKEKLKTNTVLFESFTSFFSFALLRHGITRSLIERIYKRRTTPWKSKRTDLLIKLERKLPALDVYFGCIINIALAVWIFACKKPIRLIPIQCNFRTSRHFNRNTTPLFVVIRNWKSAN